jgi:hypothetical protein
LLEGSKLYLPVFHLFCEHHFLHLFWVPWPAMLLLMLILQVFGYQTGDPPCNMHLFVASGVYFN